MNEVHHSPEEALLPDEDRDLERALLQMFDKQWLHTKNEFLGGKSPHQMIGTVDEYKIRNLLRTLTIAGIS